MAKTHVLLRAFLAALGVIATIDVTRAACPASDQCVTYEWDFESRSCLTIYRRNAPCNDSNPCTYGDKCSSAPPMRCAGTSITCTNSNCEFRACNGTSICSISPAPAGTSCSDGDPCTYGATCDGAHTYCGTMLACVSDTCATRACNGTSTCAITPTSAGVQCDDGLGCTSDDRCDGAGGCVGRECPTRGGCEVGMCDLATQTCTYSLLPPNAACANATNPCELICDGTSPYCPRRVAEADHRFDHL